MKIKNKTLDFNCKAASLKIHESDENFSNFLESMIIDKNKSHIKIDPSLIQKTLKSYLLIRLTNIQDINERNQKQLSYNEIISNKPSSPQLNNGMNQNGVQNINEQQNIHQNNNETYYNPVLNIQKNRQADNKKIAYNMKTLIRKKSDSRKINLPSMTSKVQYSTRATRISDPKVIQSNADNYQSVNTFNIDSLNKTNILIKQELKDIPDVIYCKYIVNDTVIKKYKISVSEVNLDQPLLVMSFEENNQENQRELKKQYDNLSEIMVRSNLGYMQRQQNLNQNITEQNYIDLKLNHYLHMNSVFAMTQHMYLMKRNRIPLKISQFNINHVIDCIKSLFPSLHIIKDLCLNDSNKCFLKNDQTRIKFILISIISHIFSQQINAKQQTFNDSPQRNRTQSQNSNQMKNIGASMVQLFSPQEENSCKRLFDQNSNFTSSKTDDFKDNNNNNKQRLLKKDIHNLNQFIQDQNTYNKSSRQNNLNQQQFEFASDDQFRGKQKSIIQDSIGVAQTKFGSPQILNVQYCDSFDENSNNFSLNKDQRVNINYHQKLENASLIQNHINPSVHISTNPQPIISINQKDNTQQKLLHNLKSYHQQHSKLTKEDQLTSKQTDQISDYKQSIDYKDQVFYNFEMTQNNDEEQEDLDEGKNFCRIQTETKEDNEQDENIDQETNSRFQRFSNFNGFNPSMSVRFVEKQKDYEKNSYEISISYLPQQIQKSTGNYSPMQNQPVSKNQKQGIRGISTTINSMVGNISDVFQQTKSQNSNTNNSLGDLDVQKKIQEYEQTLVEIGGGFITNRNNFYHGSKSGQYFPFINGNQDECISKIEERVLLECIKQVSSCAMNYSIDQSGIHSITFSLLSDLPMNTISFIGQEKKRAVSVTINKQTETFPNLYNTQSMIFQQPSSTLNALKEKIKCHSISSHINMNQNQNKLGDQHFLAQKNLNNLNSYPSQVIPQYSFNQGKVHSVLNNMFKTGSNNNNNNNCNNTFNNYVSETYFRRRQTSLPTVNEKPLGQQEIKEDDSYENNCNTSSRIMKTKSKRNVVSKNSISLTNLDKPPIDNQFPMQGVIFDKLVQVIASNSLVSENKYKSPKLTQKEKQQPVLSGSHLPRNQNQSPMSKYITNFQEAYQMSQKQDDSSSFSSEIQSAIKIENERKEEDFYFPRTSLFKIKRYDQNNSYDQPKNQ